MLAIPIVSVELALSVKRSFLKEDNKKQAEKKLLACFFTFLLTYSTLTNSNTSLFLNILTNNCAYCFVLVLNAK